MRVLHLVTDRDRRGAQVFARDLAAGLDLLGLRNEVVALTRGEHGDLLPVPALGSTRLGWATLRALRAKAADFDVVVAHGSSTLPACAVALVGGPPFVYRQISDPIHWAGGWPRRLRVASYLRRAASIVVLAPSLKSLFAERYWLREEHMAVIPNAVPGAGFRPAAVSDRARSRARFGLGEAASVITYLGALAPEKGVADVIAAMGALPPTTELLVVGDGPERHALESAGQQIAPGRVKFAGSIDDPLAGLDAADMLVLPSHGGDSMPAVLIEAGLCELPVVSTPVEAIPEVVENGCTGLIVPIGNVAALTDALHGLVADDGRRRAMGLAARDRCRQHYTIEATAPLWSEVLCSARRGRRK